MNATMTIPTHATHVVLDREGEALGWATSEAVAQAVARRHTGAYVATHVSWELKEAERMEAIRELEALYEATPPPPTPVEAFEQVLTQAGMGWAFEDEPTRKRCAHGYARAVDGFCRRCDAEHVEGVRKAARVTHMVAEDAPAKLTVGFTAGGFLAKRSRTALRRAGIALPKRVSERSIANAIRTSGYTPEIVPANEL